MKAVSFMPTGIVNRAEINAMCSLPLPEASERATSKSSLRWGFSFSCISVLNERRSFDESTSIILHFGFVNGFSAALSFRIKNCSASSMRLISAEIWP